MTQDNTAAQRFVDALQHLEQSRDVDGFVDAVFAADVELFRPEVNRRLGGRDGAREFWQQYLSQFRYIASTFVRATQQGDLAVLEWVSEGERSSGGAITYRGVSVLDLDDQGRVRRFATYFDTAAFVDPTATAS